MMPEHGAGRVVSGRIHTKDTDCFEGGADPGSDLRFGECEAGTGRKKCTIRSARGLACQVFFAVGAMGTVWVANHLNGMKQLLPNPR